MNKIIGTLQYSILPENEVFHIDKVSKEINVEFRILLVIITLKVFFSKILLYFVLNTKNRFFCVTKGHHWEYLWLCQEPSLLLEEFIVQVSVNILGFVGHIQSLLCLLLRNIVQLGTYFLEDSELTLKGWVTLFFHAITSRIYKRTLTTQQQKD